MRTTTLTAAALSLVVIVACSKKDQDAGEKNTRAKPAPTKKKPAAGNETTAVAKAAAKKVVKVAKPATLGPVPGEVAFGKFKLVKCATDGPPMQSESFSGAVKALTATDKVVYVVDNNDAIRKYKVGPGPACTLTLDTGFGDKGVLKPAKKPRVIAADHKGTLYVVSDRKLWRESDGKLVDFCKADMFATDSIAFASDDSFALASGFGGKWFRVELSADSCTKKPWAYQPKLEFSNADIIGDKVYMTGKNGGVRAKFSLMEFGLSGGKASKTFETGKKLGDKNLLCQSNGAVGCGKDICVVDANCRKMMVFSPDGKSTNIKFKKDHFDHSYIWAVAIGQASPDVAYLAVSTKQPKDKTKPKAKPIHRGFVYRLYGLAQK